MAIVGPPLIKRKNQMAIAQRTVDYAVEVDALLALVNLIATDAKAKKSPSDIAVDALPKLISVLSGISGLGDELSANKSAVEKTVGYRAGELVSILTA